MITTSPSTPTTNPNADWLNLRGTWLTHLIMATLLRLLFGMIPGASRELAWTLTNLTYNLVTFLLLHWLVGTPFDLNQGEYGALTLWEQIDGGRQFTPTRKFLTAFPIVLFLVSTHYSRYDLVTFGINFGVLVIQLVAKLPAMHLVRIFGINRKQPID